MKGVVFTEFVEMVERSFSPEVMDRVLLRVAPASGGAYTSVGTYPFDEMMALVQGVAAEVGQEVPALLREFGRQLFTQFQQKFPEIFVEAADAFAFLEQVEGIIHVEVRKLYPDAELPAFEIRRAGPDTMTMVYDSPRALSAFGAGLMLGCFEHFGEAVEVAAEDLSGGAGTKVRFTLTRRPSAAA
ncbi:MAG: heme NO-binding domain-containing protein [Planctomycetes bacterium]|nr:heme NO-binding domain-containing protein [Planctomycetota bacterium]